MNKTKYNQLREEIIRCCPKLNIPIVKMTAEQLEEIATDCGYFDFNKFIKDRPISLEDCLIAIDKKYTGTICVDATGEFMKWNDPDDCVDLNIFWKPNIPLQDQSDECKELLWDLICKDG